MRENFIPYGIDQLAGQEVESSTLTLEKIKYALEVAENPVVLQDMRIEQRHDLLSHHIITAVKGYFYGREVLTTEAYEFVPASWWDHLKQTLKNRFKWLSRLHVITRGIATATKHMHVCPHLDLSDGGRHLAFLRYDGAKGYMISGLEDRAREIVDLWKKGAYRYGSEQGSLDEAIHRLRIMLERHDKQR